MNKEKNDKMRKIKEIYGAFHVKMKDIIKKQSDLIERIGKHVDSKKIEKVRDKIKNL